MTAWKSATKEQRKWSKKIQFIPLPIWMGHLDDTLLQSNKKIFSAKYLFDLALNECFVTPERLYFSMTSSENKSGLLF